MSERDLDPMPPDLQQLVDAEQRAPAPSRETLECVFSRLEASLAAPPAAASPTQPAPSPAPSPLSPVAAASLSAKTVLLVGMGFFSGGIAGAALYAAVVPVPPAKVVYLPAPTPPAPEQAASQPVAAKPEPPPTRPLPARRPEVPAAPPREPTREEAAPSSDTELAGERRLLEIARTALARGKAPEALGALAEHGRLFPLGQLAEEREALSVQALVRDAKYDDARERGRRFRADHPDSLLSPVVDAALAQIP